MSADLKELLSREAQRISPGPAPIDRVVADMHTRVRRRRLGASAVAAALAVLAVAGPWAVGWRGEDSTVDRPAGVLPSNPVWGPYRVGDTVYLSDDVKVSDEKLADQMAIVPDGVVYSTDTGRIVLFTQDGVKRQIGDDADTHAGPIRQRFPELASDPDAGWVAWMEEPSGKDYGDIVLYDTTAGTHGQEVDRLRVGFDGPRDCGKPRTASYGPFAVDDRAVYYCTAEGDFVWRPTQGDGEPEQILPVAGDPTTSDDYVLDVRAGQQVVQRYGDGPPQAEIMPVGTTRPQTTIRGDFRDGFLSPDGRYLAGHEPMEVYDTSTGQRVTPDYGAGQGRSRALTMAFTDDGGVVYALVDDANEQASIVTCSLPDGECRTQVSGLRTTTVDGDTVTYRGIFFANQRHQ